MDEYLAKKLNHDFYLFSDTDKFNVILDPPVLPNFFGAKFTAIIKLYSTAFC